MAVLLSRQTQEPPRVSFHHFFPLEIVFDKEHFLGSYVANRVSDKLTPVHEKIFCCRSGSAADTQYVSDVVKFWLDLHW
jgi:hypothetical protein